MNDLSSEDMALIMKLYYKNNECVKSAIRKFCTLKGLKKEEQFPKKNTIRRMIKRFESTASCHKISPGGRKSSDFQQKVETHFESSLAGTVTCRKAGSQLDISKSYVHQLLRYNLKLYPYKPQTERFLSEKTKQERIIFCEKLLAMIDQDETFLDKILFSDESQFELQGGNMNRQNTRFWGKEPPPESQIIIKQFPKKCMVWCGFSAKTIVGPFFFNSNVNAETYEDMLSTFTIPALKAKHKFSNTIFMQDGATPHTANSTKTFLMKHFGNRVISRGHDFEWPGYSPDLNPLDFALWGYVNDCITKRNCTDILELQQAIEDVIKQIPQNFYINSIRSLPNRCVMCIEAEGGIFESK